MKTQVHHHACNLIIESEGGKEFLVDVYDDTYPRVTYRGRANLTGGNHNPDDYSPEKLLKREIEEE